MVELKGLLYTKEENSMEYASNGKGNLGVTLGAIGTGLSVFGGALSGLLGGRVDRIITRACRVAKKLGI